jgi:TadE-like protein
MRQRVRRRVLTDRPYSRNGAGESDRGALTLSYVIILPVVLFAIMVMAQAAVWYLARSAALSAARQGVDAARVEQAAAGSGPEQAVSFARSAAPGFLLDPRASPVGTTRTVIVITVRGRVPTLVPLLKLTVSQTARGPVERFTRP